jgi:hypothetical protein
MPSVSQSGSLRHRHWWQLTTDGQERTGLHSQHVYLPNLWLAARRLGEQACVMWRTMVGVRWLLLALNRLAATSDMSPLLGAERT